MTFCDHHTVSIPAVTVGLVEELAQSNSNLCNSDGTPNIAACLFVLGFKVKQDENGKWVGWSTNHNMLVRVKSRPYELYRTTVFTGIMRKNVKGIEGNKFIYTDTIHKMHRLYDKEGILSVDIKLDDSQIYSIHDIGSAIAYKS